MQRNRLLLAVLGVLTVAIVVLAAKFFLPKRIVIDADRVVEGDFAVAKGERLVLKNGAKLDVRGSMTADGEIMCEDGPLQLVVQEDLTVNRRLSCVGSASAPGSIAIVVGGAVTMDPKVKVVTNGTLQFVDRAEKLLATPRALEAVFEDTVNDTGSGQRLGPLSQEGAAFNRIARNGVLPSLVSRGVEAALAQVSAPAEAQNGAPNGAANAAPVSFSGKWQIIGDGETPPEKIDAQTPNPEIKKVLLYFNFGAGSDVRLQDLEISGPDGHIGNNVYDTCEAVGGDGQDAMRLNVSAAKLTIGNFTLNLGDGGAGGIARTKKECDHGRATGGNGGKPGNFKMMASENFQIAGAFTINPGTGGNGGLGEAYGKDAEAGCGNKGGDATARGGKGGDSVQLLATGGSVGGMTNIEVGDIQAGQGGDAIAQGGLGGAGNVCGCPGGKGGQASAVAGSGGSAKDSGGAGFFRVAAGGNGGNATSNAGIGGSGGSCGPNKRGGVGGEGGASAATAGKGGSSATQPGEDGEIKADVGGKGGNGGDGCLAGEGGKGGSGNPAGSKGAPGKINCIIEVIKVKDTYLFTDGLHLANPDACGEKHWHGTAVSTNGTLVPDPAPDRCGHCAESQCPVMTVEAKPPFVPESVLTDPFAPSPAETELRRRLQNMFEGVRKPASN